MTAALASVGLPPGLSPRAMTSTFKANLKQLAVDNAGPLRDALEDELKKVGRENLMEGLDGIGSVPALGLIYTTGKAIWTWRGNAFLKMFGPMDRKGGALYTAPYLMADGLRHGLTRDPAGLPKKDVWPIINSPYFIGLKNAGIFYWVNAFDSKLAELSPGVDGSFQAKAALEKAKKFADSSSQWLEGLWFRIGRQLASGKVPIVNHRPTDRAVMNRVRTGLDSPRMKKRWLTNKTATADVSTVDNKYLRYVLYYPPGTFASQGSKLLRTVPKQARGKPVLDVWGVKTYDNGRGAHIYRTTPGNPWKKIGVVDFETAAQRAARQAKLNTPAYGTRTPKDSAAGALGDELAKSGLGKLALVAAAVMLAK